MLYRLPESERVCSGICKAHNDKNFVAPSTLIKYIDNKELQHKLNNIRRFRNNMIHNADFNRLLPIEEVANTLSELRKYLKDNNE